MCYAISILIFEWLRSRLVAPSLTYVISTHRKKVRMLVYVRSETGTRAAPPLAC